MVIQSGNVALSGNYNFRRTNLSAVSYTSWGGAVDKAGITATTTPSATDSEQISGTKEEAAMTPETEAAEAAAKGTEMQNDAWESLFASSQTDVNRLFEEKPIDADYSGNGKVQFNSLRNLLMLISGKEEIRTRKMTPQDLFQQMMDIYERRMQSLYKELGLASDSGVVYGSNASDVHTVAKNLSAITPTQKFENGITIQHFYEEKEESSFYSAGTVVTEDGRQIEFDIEAVMSRTFQQSSNVKIDYGSPLMRDPLVINLEGGTTEVSDQKFLFDIDCDGEEDNISLLAKGCGFLALDRNGDGRINDGSELFGTKSGNGFEDLAVFDMDGNGWIDENDPIFNKLRIWTKDETGNDRLIALGVAGVGAIYLGNVQTQFSLNSEADNTTNAMVRRSGVFLHENGVAGVIQQVDMAVG